MRKCCLSKYLRKKQKPNLSPTPHRGYSPTPNPYSYYNYQPYAPQPQNSYYQVQPQYNYNYGWTSYPNTNPTHNYGSYIPSPPQIIYEIRDRSPSDDEEYYYEERKPRRSRSVRKEKLVCEDLMCSKSVSRVRHRVPTGPPPPPAKITSKEKNSSGDEYRPVYTPNDNITLANYSDDPSDFGAAYHQSSIQPLPQSDNPESATDTLLSETEIEIETISVHTQVIETTNQPHSDTSPSPTAPPSPGQYNTHQSSPSTPSPMTPSLGQNIPIQLSPSTPSPITPSLDQNTPIQSSGSSSPPIRPNIELNNPSQSSLQTLSPIKEPAQTPYTKPTKYYSEIERAIKTSNQPIDVELDELIKIPELGVEGYWINKSECINWKGDGITPLDQYKINVEEPEVLNLKYGKCVERVEYHEIKFLKPIPQDPPGDLIITQEPDYQPPEAPPIILRQLAPDHCDPKPKIIRERPPVAPEKIPQQHISIPGGKLLPPARRVIIEKLAKQPDEIQGTTVERWLPYDKQTRRVVYNPAPEIAPIKVEPNTEFVWETPCVEKRTQIENLGVEFVNPDEYLRKFNGKFIKSKSELPEFALTMPVPGDVDLNASSSSEIGLVGDIQALKLIDINKEGLEMYRKYVE